MSQKTLDTLQTLKDEYEQNDVHEEDPIGHFVERQAVKLGLHVSSGKWTFFFCEIKIFMEGTVMDCSLTQNRFYSSAPQR